MYICVGAWGVGGGKSERALILTLFYSFCENNIKRGGWLIMHHLVALIAERQGGTCVNQRLSQLLSVMCLMSKVNVENRDLEKMKSYGSKVQVNSSFNNFITSNKTFAGMVAGSQQMKDNQKEVVVSEFVKPYKDLYDKAVIGRVKDLWTLRKMDVLLKEARHGDSNIKYLGGMVIRCPGFRVVYKCGGLAIAFERLTWLNIHVAPLHLAGNEVYDSIGRCFGKVIHTSQRQSEDNNLSVDCVCIMTDEVKRIEEVVTIIDDGKRFRIWVEEERGEWVPDSVENRCVQSEEEEEEGGDVLSEDENPKGDGKDGEASTEWATGLETVNMDIFIFISFQSSGQIT
ncbi:hypothetical protein Hanom_Chr15g01368301 [Helianthus anomalus]